MSRAFDFGPKADALKMVDRDYGIGMKDFGMKDREFGMKDRDFGMKEFGMKDREFGMKDREFSVKDREFSMKDFGLRDFGTKERDYRAKEDRELSRKGERVQMESRGRREQRVDVVPISRKNQLLDLVEESPIKHIREPIRLLEKAGGSEIEDILRRIQRREGDGLKSPSASGSWGQLGREFSKDSLSFKFESLYKVDRVEKGERRCRREDNSISSLKQRLQRLQEEEVWERGRFESPRLGLKF
jgi:hypothetical protein